MLVEKNYFESVVELGHGQYHPLPQVVLTVSNLDHCPLRQSLRANYHNEKIPKRYVAATLCILFR